MNCILHLSNTPQKYIIPAGFAFISVALAAIAYLGYQAQLAQNACIQALEKALAKQQAELNALSQITNQIADLKERIQALEKALPEQNPELNALNQITIQIADLKERIQETEDYLSTENTILKLQVRGWLEEQRHTSIGLAPLEAHIRALEKQLAPSEQEYLELERRLAKLKETKP